ncbi:MAG: Fic family protein [Lachnospiraceae bacterium]|nr:Fic family protein [Lachnospiraceae bacterium]
MNTQMKLQDASKILLAQTALLFEGIHLDYTDTLRLLNGVDVHAFGLDEVDTIILRNVVNALHFLENTDFNKTNIDLDLYITLNSILAEEQALFVGKLRDIPTSIGCIEEEIGVYDKKDIMHEIERLNFIDAGNVKNVVPKVFCRLARMQPFFDGNKRSTNFLCNAALNKKNLGIFFVNDENVQDFNLHLKDYYQGKNEKIFQFIGDKLMKSAHDIDKIYIRFYA